jgi:hypothetical protein
MNLEDKFEQKTVLLDVVGHKANIPSDFKYLTQMAYSTNTSACPEGSNCDYGWRPIRLTTNPYNTSICLDLSITRCDQCQHEYTISPSGVITLTLDEGTVLMSYLAYPQDSDGFALIPDDENIKEAIMHYVLYRYWMQKDMMKEDGAEKRMKFHLQMWSTLSRKALSLNLPDISKMENLKNIHNRLVPRSNRWDQLFQSLGDRENVNF